MCTHDFASPRETDSLIFWGGLFGGFWGDLFCRSPCGPLSRGASGGCLHGGASLKGEKAHFALSGLKNANAKRRVF